MTAVMNGASPLPIVSASDRASTSTPNGANDGSGDHFAHLLSHALRHPASGATTTGPRTGRRDADRGDHTETSPDKPAAATGADVTIAAGAMSPTLAALAPAGNAIVTPAAVGAAAISAPTDGHRTAGVSEAAGAVTTSVAVSGSSASAAAGAWLASGAPTMTDVRPSASATAAGPAPQGGSAAHAGPSTAKPTTPSGGLQSLRSMDATAAVSASHSPAVTPSLAAALPATTSASFTPAPPAAPSSSASVAPAGGTVSPTGMAPTPATAPVHPAASPDAQPPSSPATVVAAAATRPARTTRGHAAPDATGVRSTTADTVDVTHTLSSTIAPAATSTPTTTNASPAVLPSYAATQPELATVLAQVRATGQGVHEMVVNLHPAELGAVKVTASLRDGQMTVTVACADESTRQAVAAALPGLHHDLHSAVSSVTIATPTDAGDHATSGQSQHPADAGDRGWRGDGNAPGKNGSTSHHGRASGDRAATHRPDPAAAPTRSARTTGRPNIDRML